MSLVKQYRPIVLQLTRFGIIGLSAAAVYVAAIYMMVQFGKLNPLHANVLAFFIAFFVSYFGHRYWTFAAEEGHARNALPRFVTIALMGFAMNQGLFYIFLQIFRMYYLMAVLIVLMIVPPLTFLSSKLWAFRR